MQRLSIQIASPTPIAPGARVSISHMPTFSLHLTDLLYRMDPGIFFVHRVRIGAIPVVDLIDAFDLAYFDVQVDWYIQISQSITFDIENRAETPRQFFIVLSGFDLDDERIEQRRQRRGQNRLLDPRPFDIVAVSVDRQEVFAARRVIGSVGTPQALVDALNGTSELPPNSDTDNAPQTQRKYFDLDETPRPMVDGGRQKDYYDLSQAPAEKDEGKDD